MVTIVLAGGSPALGPVWQVKGAEVPARVTVDHYGRHVHFERADQVEIIDGRPVPVFRWTYSMAIAE